MGTKASVMAAYYEHVAQVARDTMLLARVSVTNATPVDTGHASSNWVLSVGTPYTQVDGSRDAVSFAAQDAGDKEAMDFSGADVRQGLAIYLRNNVPYLKFLDAGWSQQAPPNFIRLALTAAGQTRHAPVGTRRAVRSMLRQVAIAAIHRG